MSVSSPQQRSTARICYILSYGLREIHLHINSIVRLCQRTTRRQSACLFTPSVHALFHFPFRCRCFHSPHYYTVTWICTRCSLPPRHHPFSIIKIMHPIYLKISSSARQIRNLLSSNGDGTMGTHMLCMR